MADDSYLRWLVRETPTSWWHDSAEPEELRRGLAHGATGVTTNPILSYQALCSNPELRARAVQAVPSGAKPAERAEELMRHVVCNAAQMLQPVYERMEGRQGYVCAQVNPAKAADREAMLAMARRFHAWAPNIAVKLPATAAGLDVLEECAAEGITITATVSFNVPQVIAIAERYRHGLSRAQQAGHASGQCFAVIMIGRLDDYLRDMALDGRVQVSESDIQQAGLAVTKRAHALYQERSYDATLIVAALRGTYHMTELAGAKLTMSIHPRYQALLLQHSVPRQTRIHLPVAPEVIERLRRMPEFARSYEFDGMAAADFISFGLTQRTLNQFSETGWMLLESFKLS